MDSAVLKFVKPSDVSEELEKTKTYAEKIARISVAEVYPLTKKAVSLSAAFLIDPCVDGFPARFSNVGLLNQLEGLVDVDIDSDGGDPNYALHVRIGIEQYAGIRSDYSFGRESVRLGGAQIPTHHMIHVKGKPSDYSNYLPGKIIVDGNKCNTELRFTSPKRGAVDPTKHTVAPGSILPRKDSSPESPSYELSKWVSFKGTTTPTIYETPDLIRGVAAGNVIHLMVPHWNANYRHELCKPFTGFLARHAKEAEAINTDPSHPLHRQVITTLRDRSDAQRLLELICKAVGDDELKDRLRLLNGALDDCDAGRKVLGRPALSSFVNDSALVLQLDSMLTLGVPLNSVNALLDDLVQDKTSDEVRYFVKSALIKGEPYGFSQHHLSNDYKGKTVPFGKKSISIFELFERSEGRLKATGGESLFPDKPPGELLQVINRVVLPDDYNGDSTGALTFFNSWVPYVVKPIHRPQNSDVLEDLHWLVSNITRSNHKQAEKLLDWTADMFQNPGQKSPLAMVAMGDKGWGKSTYFNDMMSALVGPHKYQALTGTVLTGKFSLDVFKGRIYVCFNEAPTLPDPAKALLGNYIKDEWVGGEGKNDKASTIRNLARIAVTTNRMDFNINVKNLPVGSQERALYYIRCWDVASLNVSVAEAIKHRESLQPKFERFRERLKQLGALEELMHFFQNRKFDHSKKLSLDGSAHFDPELVALNLSYVDRTIKLLFEENHFGNDGSETGVGFSYRRKWGESRGNGDGGMTVLGMRGVLDMYKHIIAHYDINAGDLLERLVNLGLARRDGNRWLPVVKYGTALQLFQEMTLVAPTPAYELGASDFGEIDRSLFALPDYLKLKR